jgi:hypothetical protein
MAILPYSPPLWEEWLATTVPFGVVVLLGLVLLRRIRHRLQPPIEAPRAVAPSERGSGGSSAVRFRVAAIIGCIVVVIVGLVMESGIHEAAWHGTALFYVMLGGIPLSFLAAVAYATITTWAVRRTRWPEMAVGAAVGAASCALVQWYARLGGLVVPASLFTSSAVLLPIVAALLAVIVEWRVRQACERRTHRTSD